MKHTLAEIEEMFYNGKLNELLPAIKEELERCDYYDRLMIDNITDNAEECKKAVNELSGLHGIIVKVYHFSEGALDVAEPKTKVRIRQEAQTKGEKLTDATVASQAEVEVSIYRRIRCYLLGYVEGLNKSIGTLQSILKYEASPKGTVARAGQQTNEN